MIKEIRDSWLEKAMINNTIMAKQDVVNHPQHYADKKIEVIDYIEDTLSQNEFTGYCMGNVLKYISRWRKKNGIEDLEKARVYLGWMIESAKKEQAKKPEPAIMMYTSEAIESNGLEVSNDP